MAVLDIFRHLFPNRGYLKASPKQHIETPDHGLFTLPVELIQYISTFLPLSSVAALSLCNSSLRHALGTGSWESLRRKNDDERKTFLSLLDRDLPEYFLCHRCTRFHHRSKLVLPPIRSYGSLACFGCDYLILDNEEGRDFGAAGRRWAPASKLRFSHIQSVLKNHYMGPEFGIPLDALTFTKIHPCYHYDGSHYTKMLSTKARIIDGRVFLCIQDWHWVPANKREYIMTLASTAKLCRHLKDLDNVITISQLTECRLSHLPGAFGCQICTATQNCNICLMSYNVDVKDFSSRGIALIFTKWLDVGDGVSSHDGIWRRHQFYVQPIAPGAFQPTRSIFEKHDDLTLGSFTETNTSRLMDGLKIWGKQLPWKRYGPRHHVLGTTFNVPFLNMIFYVVVVILLGLVGHFGAFQ